MWTPWAIPAALLLCFAWVVAALAYATAPRRAVNRLLALVLFFEGAGLGLGGVLGFSLTAREWFVASTILGNMCIAALVPLYPAFLGVALDTPLVRPFRPRGAQAALLATAVLFAATYAAAPGLFIAGVRADPAGVSTWSYDATRLDDLVTFAFGLVSVFGLVAAISAWRRAAAGTLARLRARSFVMAFGIRDGYFAFLVLVVVPIFAAIRPEGELRTPEQILAAKAAYLLLMASLAAYYAFLARGIFRGRILDIDVKIRWTVKQSTVAGVFVGVFLVVAQLAQNLLSESLGWAVGGLAAGLLLFALAPVQRLAERVASAALPGVRSVGEMSPDERRAVYRDTARLAWSDGTLSMDERQLLEGLRARLGITPDDALRLEREAGPG